MLRALELFGGIGAFRIALEKSKIPFTIVDYVEYDKNPVRSYNAIFNENYETQNIYDWDKDIDIDLIFHGSPCTDFSKAGLNLGGAEGADTLADNLARKRGIKMTVHYPKLSQYKTRGKEVFFERNKRIAEECDVLLALYNPSKRSGTANTVKYAKEFKKPIFFINHENHERHINSWDYDLKKIV